MDIFADMGPTFANAFGKSHTLEMPGGGTVTGQMIYMPNAKRTEIGDYGAEIVTHSPELHVPAAAVSAAGYVPDDLAGAFVTISEQLYSLSEPVFDGVSMIQCKLYTA